MTSKLDGGHFILLTTTTEAIGQESVASSAGANEGSKRVGAGVLTSVRVFRALVDICKEGENHMNMNIYYCNASCMTALAHTPLRALLEDSVC